MEERIKALYENRIFRTCLLIILAALAALSVFQGVRNGARFSQDFQWDAAKALAMRIDPYTESLSPTGALDTGWLRDYYAYYESIDAPQKMEANQFPSLLMLLFPYTLLPPDLARFVWLASSLLCSAGIIWLLRLTFLKDCDRFLFAILSLLMLAGTPYRNQLGVGQHTLFSLFFFLLAVWLSAHVQGMKGTIWTVVCLSICYFKYTLTAILALYFVYKRKWRELILSVAVHVVLTVVAAFWLQKPFTDMILMPLKVSSALSSEGGLDFGALFGGSWVAFALAGIVFILLFILALWTKEGYDVQLISVLLLWSLIILYHRTYDFFPLVMVAGFFLTEENGEKRIFGGKVTAIAYALLLLCVFFLLRLFHENLPIRIFTGIFYYAFTILLSILLICASRTQSSRGSQRTE